MSLSLMRLGRESSPFARPMAWWAESLRRERTLTLLALFMALALIPTAIALGLDERTFRGVSVWAKPMKFMASLALFQPPRPGSSTCCRQAANAPGRCVWC